MNRLFSLTLLALAAVLSFPLAAVAQNDAVPATVSDLINSPEAYVGRTVIVEDNLSEYLNPKTFLLGEDAAIGEVRVLVVNTSGEMLPLNLFPGDLLVVTGTVHPSLNMRIDNNEVVMPDDRNAYRRNYTGVNNDVLDTVETPTPDPLATPDNTDMMDDMHGGTQRDAIEFLYSGGLPDAYDGYLVIEVSNIDDVVYSDSNED